MKYEQFKDSQGRIGEARIFGEIPEVEPLNTNEERDYFIRCDSDVLASQVRSYDGGFYKFYTVTKFCGRTMPMLSEDDTAEDCCETFKIAVWNDYDEIDG